MINLSKALIVKKRLIEKINKISEDIKSNHEKTVISNINEDKLISFAEPVFDVDLGLLFKQRRDLVNKLIDLKLKINEANKGQQENIFRLSELKSEIILWKGLKGGNEDTTSYLGRDYRPTRIFRVLSKDEIDNKVEELQNKIDKIQTEMDYYNMNTKIDVPDL